MTVIRPVIKYVLQVYHFGLTSAQSDKLEGLQRRSLKIIFGFHWSYESLLEQSGLELLSERRYKLCLSFAQKCSENPHNNHWFPLNPECEYDLRTHKKYKEEFAATERLRRNPIFSLRRLLNEDNWLFELNDFKILT